MADVGTLNITISKYKGTPNFQKLNRANAVNPDDPKAFDSEINTDPERLEAAKLICGKPFTDVKKAEACLVKELGIKEAAPASGGAAKGVEIKSASPKWGKNGLTAKIDSGSLKISGTLEDSELYSVRIAPAEVKVGQKLVFDVKVKGAFTWGGKVMVLVGMSDPEVVGGELVAADNKWIVINSPGKATIKVPYDEAETVTALSIKTGGMSSASITISNIRVE